MLSYDLIHKLSKLSTAKVFGVQDLPAIWIIVYVNGLHKLAGLCLLLITVTTNVKYKSHLSKCRRLFRLVYTQPSTAIVLLGTN